MTSPGRSLLPFIGLGLLILVLWVSSGSLLYSDPNRGTFGDMFGAINALFSGLAFAGLIFTILLQRDELVEQRRELRHARRQLRNQTRTLTLERHERIFFNLLGLQHALHARVRLPDQLNASGGEDSFSLLWKELNRTYNTLLKMQSGASPAETRARACELFFTQYDPVVRHYFSALHELLEYVAHIDAPDDMRLARLARAHLSTDELLLLSYFALSTRAPFALKSLIEKFSMLASVEPSMLLDPFDQQTYAPQAFSAT